jgi:hypothetical protein
LAGIKGPVLQHSDRRQCNVSLIGGGSQDAGRGRGLPRQAAPVALSQQNSRVQGIVHYPTPLPLSLLPAFDYLFIYFETLLIITAQDLINVIMSSTFIIA